MDTALAQKVDWFFTQFKRYQYKKGEIFLHPNDTPGGVYYLKQGIVKMYAISKKGDELVLNIYKPISFFPMSWAINETENSYYYEVVDDVEVYRAPKDASLEFLRNNPEVLFDLTKRLYRGLDGVLLRMTYLMSGSAYTRLVTELLIQTKRFGEKTDIARAYELHISETDLAARAGMTRETVSREMKTLKTKGIVQINKNSILIHDVVKLEDELGE